MNTITEFDKQLKIAYKDDFSMLRIVEIILLVIGCPTYIIPVASGDFPIMLIFQLFLLIILAAQMHMQPLLYVKQDNRLIPIYRIIQQTPIKKEDFIRSRTQYLNHFLGKVAGACLLFQLLGNLLSKNSFRTTCLGLLIILALFLLFWLIRLLGIRMSTR